jgi:predicted GNAT family acetyltransferase
MNIQLILNINSPQAYVELEFDKLGVAKKLVKFVVQKKKLK